MALLDIRNNKPMQEARTRIDENFAQTILYPLAENENPLGLVGMAGSDVQQGYFAIDGIHYLSPETGLMKKGDQHLEGDLTVDGDITGESLTITPRGAKIATSFYVYNDEALTSVSFGVDTNKNVVSYGTFRSKGTIYGESNLSINGTITATANGHRFGSTTISSLTISASLSVGQTISCNTLTARTSISAPTITATSTINGGNLNAGNGAFSGTLTIGTGGRVDWLYARPMYCSSGDVPPNLQYGCLYGQYK